LKLIHQINHASGSLCHLCLVFKLLGAGQSQKKNHDALSLMFDVQTRRCCSNSKAKLKLALHVHAHDLCVTILVKVMMPSY
jgi:hypothetical protein